MCASNHYHILQSEISFILFQLFFVRICSFGMVGQRQQQEGTELLQASEGERSSSSSSYILHVQQSLRHAAAVAAAAATPAAAAASNRKEWPSLAVVEFYLHLVVFSLEWKRWLK